MTMKIHLDLTMRMHVDLPNDDCARGAARKLDLMKIAARRLELQIERMERKKQLSLVPFTGKKKTRRRADDASALVPSPAAPDGSDRRPKGGANARLAVGRPRRGGRFSLGQAARPTEMHAPSSREEGLIKIARLREGDGAWVRRSGDGGKWTYGVVKEKGGGPNATLAFTVDEKGSTKKFPLAYWHKFVRAVEEGSNKTSAKKEDHSTRPSEKKAREVHNDWDEFSSSSASSSFYVVGLKEDCRSLTLKVIEDHELSTYALAGDDQLPVASPPIRQVWCRSSAASIFKSCHCANGSAIGSGASASDAPTKSAGGGEVERTLRATNSLSPNTGQKLRQSKPIDVQALMKGKACKSKEGAEADEKMQYHSLSLPRPTQQEGPSKLLACRPKSNSPSGAGVLPTSGRSYSLPPVHLSPILEDRKPAKFARRLPPRPRPEYGALWSVSQQKGPSGERDDRRGELAKQQMFNMALKRMHSASSSRSCVAADFAYF